MKRYMPIASITVLLMLSGPASAQNQPDATALINNSIANAEQNAKAAFAYTFHENYVTSMTSGCDKSAEQEPHGEARRTSIATSAFLPPAQAPTDGCDSNRDHESSTQYEVLFIEGIPYRRVVSVNRRPLTAEATAAESKRYDAAVATIHSMSQEQRQAMMKGSNTLAVDPKQLLTHYDCKITGHEKVQKRPATVVACKLRNDLFAQSSTANPISSDIKLWIDDQQPFFSRTRATLDHTIDKNRKLTVATIQWSLIDGVWHQTSTQVEWVGPQGSGTKGKSVDIFSDFKRFRSEATILPEYLPDIPLPQQP